MRSGGIGAPGRQRVGRWIGVGATVLVVAAIVFAVAQGSGGGGGPLNAIAKAAEVTQREPGGRALFHATVTSSTMPEALIERGAMDFDDSGRARGTMIASGGGLEQDAKFLTIADGTKAYLSSELLDSLPEGKTWMEVDLSSAAARSGSSTPTVGSPKEGLKILEQVLGAEKIGEEAVDRVPTTHYRGTLPASEEVLGATVHLSESQVDVWIDAQDRVRRVHVVVSGSVNEDEAATTTEMTFDYVDFGRVPKIGLPDPGEVFDVTSEVEAKVKAKAEED